MAANAQTTDFAGHHIAQTIMASLSASGTRLMTGLRGMVRSLQTARMMTVLANMSDHQLEQIGITRADIPVYAETLIADRLNETSQ